MILFTWSPCWCPVPSNINGDNVQFTVRAHGVCFLLQCCSVSECSQLLYCTVITNLRFLTMDDENVIECVRNTTMSVLHTITSNTVTNQHTRRHPIVIICNTKLSVLHTVSSTTAIHTPATKNQHTRRAFYRPPIPALSATQKGPRTPPHSHLRPLGWHKPDHT